MLKLLSLEKLKLYEKLKLKSSPGLKALLCHRPGLVRLFQLIDLNTSPTVNNRTNDYCQHWIRK